MTEHYSHVSDDAARSATLMLDDGVSDAEFEEVSEPVPQWVVEKLNGMDSDTWEQIRAEILKS